MNSNLKGVQKVLATLTMATTVLSLAGFAALTPVTALAAVPADYGLHEGDMISADGVAGTAGYDPDIYIVNDWGYKRLFLNPVIFNFYGHLSGGWAAVKHVSQATRDAFPTSGLFRNCETNDQAVWGLEVTGEDTGVLHHIALTGAQAVTQDPNFFKKVFCINNNEFNWYPKGSEYTSLNQVPDYNRGGTATPTPTPAPSGLNGGAGTLQDATEIGSLSNEEVGEGENNIPVAGLDLEADSGSDLRVLSVRVSFEEQQAGGSEDLDDYADVVSLWFNGSKVATANVSDFSEDDSDNDGANEWSKSISLTGDAIIRMSQTEDLKVAVSALDNIDSGDLNANNDWQVTIENVRYVDAQGAITTDDSTNDIPLTESFNFVDFAAAADLELNLDEASDNPKSRVVDVDDTDSTDNVVLLTGNLEATGGDIEVKELTVTVASTGADLDAIVSQLSLEVDGDVVQTLTPSTDCDGLGVCVFDDVDKSIAEDDSVKLRVLADINGTDDIGVEGATLTATMDNADTVAEDQNGDDLTGSDLTGAANGEEQAFYSEGIMVTFVSGSASKVTGDAEPDLGTFTIKFDVKAFDTDAFVDNSCVSDGNQTPGEGVSFTHTGSASVTSCVLDNGDDETVNNNFQVSNGATEHFTLTVAITGDDTFVETALESINWGASDSAPVQQFYTFSLDDFKTGSIYLSSN